MISICDCVKNSTSFSDFVQKRPLNQGKSNLIMVTCLKGHNKYVFKIFSNDESSYLSFAREKQVHSIISHPNIIQYISSLDFSFENATYPTILMEYAPYGDFFDLSLDYNLKNEKLIRTYFHHLIEGLEHLHSHGIAHLDLKLENLLLGKDFLLKIADFDLAQKNNSEAAAALILGGGTANYRAPEILSGKCTNYFAADIYSAGICLYTLIAGAFPFFEERDQSNITLFRYDTYAHSNQEFWNENEALIEGNVSNSYFSESLRDLLNKMWVKNPSQRITIDEIKKSRWYNEPIYTEKQLKSKMEAILYK